MKQAVVRFVAALSLVITIIVSGLIPAIAQNAGYISTYVGAPPGSHVWVTTLDGVQVDSCTVQDNGGAWAPSCDIEVPHPAVLLVYIDESTLSPGSVVQENPIRFDTTTLHGRDSWGGAPRFEITQGGGAGSSDIAIVTTENGQSIYDACFILVGYSNEGCDQNQDGKITFEDIPLGTYTLRQTRDLGAGRGVPDQSIRVTGAADNDGWERFYVSVGGAGSSADLPIDIAIVTRDPETGDSITDVCYVLVDYSNEGCDRNQDGQVTFDQIPPGTYVVRQTHTPAGYPAINDFEIDVLPLGNLPNGEVLQIPLGFIVRQAPEQNAPGTRNVSVVLVDYSSGQKFTQGVCVELAGASNVGCDEAPMDGQIDFLDVAAGGPYDLVFSNVPGGWVVGANPGDAYQVTINPEMQPRSFIFVFVLLTPVE